MIRGFKTYHQSSTSAEYMYMSRDSGLPLSRGLDCQSDRQFLVWSREIGVFLTNVLVSFVS